MVTPRLVSTAVAREYLGGRHPTELGIKPIGNGRGMVWDLKLIDYALDKLAGILPPPLTCRMQAEQDSADDELERLRQRIARGPGRRAHNR